MSIFDVLDFSADLSNVNSNISTDNIYSQVIIDAFDIGNPATLLHLGSLCLTRIRGSSSGVAGTSQPGEDHPQPVPPGEGHPQSVPPGVPPPESGVPVLPIPLPQAVHAPSLRFWPARTGLPAIAPNFVNKLTKRIELPFMAAQGEILLTDTELNQLQVGVVGPNWVDTIELAYRVLSLYVLIGYAFLTPYEIGRLAGNAIEQAIILWSQVYGPGRPTPDEIGKDSIIWVPMFTTEALT